MLPLSALSAFSAKNNMRAVFHPHIILSHYLTLALIFVVPVNNATAATLPAVNSSIADVLATVAVINPNIIF